MTFAADIQAFQRKVGIRGDLILRKITLDINRDLVLATPVDTGLARSSWFIGFTRDGGTEAAPSKNGSPSLARAAQFAANLKAGGKFFITNNLPYIMPLEYGSSTQAPLGMARRTVARWQQIVDAAAGGVR